MVNWSVRHNLRNHHPVPHNPLPRYLPDQNLAKVLMAMNVNDVGCIFPILITSVAK